jgi:hypothetical protein
MDDCERLYRRLVHNVRAATPDLLTRPFEVAQLYQQLVSYRENRSALGFASNDEYELALLQLLSGVRGFLEGEPEMQHALRAELESPNPELTAYRAFATSAVRFGVGPLRDAMLRPTPEGTRTVNAPSPQDQFAIAARPTESVDTPSEAPVAPPPASAANPLRPAAIPPQPAAPIPPMPVSRTAPQPAKSAKGCQYCAGALPDAREVVFCPTCGHNLTVKHCPACSTELDVGWKFCITCGRENGVQEAK